MMPAPLKLPLVSVERTGSLKILKRKALSKLIIILKIKMADPDALLLRKRIVADKTRNFAVASGTRNNTGTKSQLYYPRTNKKDCDSNSLDSDSGIC
jgi:hypothetical protein